METFKALKVLQAIAVIEGAKYPNLFGKTHSLNSYGNGTKYHYPSKPIGQQSGIAHKLFSSK
jgi:hypothetical protein